MSKKPLRVLVTGGRTYGDYDAVDFALGEIPVNSIVVHGGAPGADSLAERIWHDDFGLTTEPHPANWEKYGAAAGPIRNQEMLDSGIDLVLAFPGGKGTKDMLSRAQKAGIEVVVYG
jgi:hypothetical protein